MDRHNADYLDVFKYSIMTANGNYTFPNDKTFETAIKENALYTYISKLCKYIFCLTGIILYSLILVFNSNKRVAP